MIHNVQVICNYQRKKKIGLTVSSFWNLRAMALQRSVNSSKLIYSAIYKVQEANQIEPQSEHDNNKMIIYIFLGFITKIPFHYRSCFNMVSELFSIYVKNKFFCRNFLIRVGQNQPPNIHVRSLHWKIFARIKDFSKIKFIKNN